MATTPKLKREVIERAAGLVIAVGLLILAADYLFPVPVAVRLYGAFLLLVGGLLIMAAGIHQVTESLMSWRWG